MSHNIIVIGAGVSGLTTALTLQLLGLDTEIYTDKTVSDTAKNAHPEFASLYPSASIIPHSVYSDRLENLFQKSQKFFYELRKQSFPGLTIHKHYEIFESKPSRPEYLDWMPNLRKIQEVEAENLPRRNDHDDLYGWMFDCIFADWPLYLPALHEHYERLGGTITHQKLTVDDIPDLPADIIINCSGTGSPELFEDSSDEQLLLLGHLLHKAKAPLITSSSNKIVSYNYTPDPSIYADSEGGACDVYCYPRKDGWILGGSRQSVQLMDIAHDGNSDKSDCYEMSGVKFPRQIVDLNSDILSTTFGLRLDKTDDLTPSVGYRYVRNKENGLRLEQEMVEGKQIHHNYGHGGAGVTLSWGCALHIASEITGQSREELQRPMLDGLTLS